MYLQSYTKMERVTVSQEHSTSNISERKLFRILEISALINQISRGIPENYKGSWTSQRSSKKNICYTCTSYCICPYQLFASFLLWLLMGLGGGGLDYLKSLYKLLTFTHYLRMHEHCSTKQNFMSQYLISLTGDNLTDSSPINHLQDGIQLFYSNKGIFQNDSEGNLKQN